MKQRDQLLFHSDSRQAEWLPSTFCTPKNECVEWVFFWLLTLALTDTADSDSIEYAFSGENELLSSNLIGRMIWFVCGDYWTILDDIRWQLSDIECDCDEIGPLTVLVLQVLRQAVEEQTLLHVFSVSVGWFFCVFNWWLYLPIFSW